MKRFRMLTQKKLLFFSVFFLNAFFWPTFVYADKSNQSSVPVVKYEYIFFDSGHSYLEKDQTLIPVNYVVVPQVDFSHNVTTTVFGSENFCKNIFYFYENKIIFYNLANEMSTATWCQVQIMDRNKQSISNYKFVFNKTFSAWCAEKDTNKNIARTVNAILNMFDSTTCSDEFETMLSDTRVLNLSNAKLTDISPIGSFLKLRSLWLDYNSLQNVDSLGSLKRLAFLSLNHNNLEGVNDLGQLSNLSWLFLNHNKIQHIKFVENLRNLKFLGLKSNQIYDTAPLAALPQTTFVLATDNPVDNGRCLKNHFGTVQSFSSKNLFLSQGKCLPAGASNVDGAIDQALPKLKARSKSKVNFSVSTEL